VFIADAAGLREAALRAHELLVVERLVLAAVFLALVAGFAVAASLVIVTGMLTVVAQHGLRRRHEVGTRIQEG
jgi:4-hydroxybenzoate polyprenyltransferase/geranylgeranylglycerol-phosphate geranylgeranyltransferase